MKSGLDYFPLEVVDDLKLRLFKAEFGVKGFGLLIELWRYIYREDGYFGKWNDDVRTLFAFENNVGCDLVSEVVSAAVRRDIFDKDMLDKYGILTSRGIQKRYFESTARRVSVNVEKAYLLIDAPIKNENVNISGENVSRNGKNVNIFSQSKVKESKEKESKEREKNGEGSPRSRFIPPTVEEVKAYCEERKNNVNAERFIDYYTANGWKIGKNAMKDWKAAVRTWEKNGIDEKKAETDSTFETDEFFEAALEKTYGRTEKEDEDLLGKLKRRFTNEN